MSNGIPYSYPWCVLFSPHQPRVFKGSARGCIIRSRERVRERISGTADRNRRIVSLCLLWLTWLWDIPRWQQQQQQQQMRWGWPAAAVERKATSRPSCAIIQRVCAACCCCCCVCIIYTGPFAKDEGCIDAGICGLCKNEPLRNCLERAFCALSIGYREKATVSHTHTHVGVLQKWFSRVYTILRARPQWFRIYGAVIGLLPIGIVF